MSINIDLPDLRALCELSRRASFTEAAHVLALTPSALSRRIAKAEAALGGRLVERTTRSMGLTSLGREVVRRIEPLLKTMEAQLSDAADIAAGRSGHLEVACVATLAQSVFPHALRQFHERYPEVRVSLRDSHATQVRLSVLERQAEFGLVPLWEPHPELRAELLARDAYRLVCAKDHPLANRRRMRWDELPAWKVLSFNPASATRQQIDAVLQAHGAALPWFDEVDTLATLLSHVEDGGMVAVLPALAAKASAHLASIALEQPVIERGIYLIRRHDVSSTLPAQYLQSRLKALMKGAGVVRAGGKS
ncbi:LysR family transcriptional regulator [uncultured Variovorax sp.]|uniref:LysR family transcriptional regulator n=1 Tax=uncultured Variovorax sp. TaxID=114708 RepID=UPI0025F81FEA|nr:LysR family transcriptional regulator [uncultured Variovorax sp.]